MKDLIRKYLQKYDIDHTENQIDKLDTFSKFVLSENEKFNLTAITDHEDFVLKHIIDSALGAKLIEKNANVIDVGSGAGFPGIILKILRPDIKITLLDSLLKRVNFLNNAISLLKLDSIFAIHSRAEDCATNPLYREKFDVATARAVAYLPTLCEYLLPFVKIGGKMLAYKSIETENEIKESMVAISTLGGSNAKLTNFTLEEISSKRCLIEIKKIKNTPKIYPRAKNKPKTCPIG